MAFSECGYSFCGTIEEVVYHEGFICNLAQRKVRDVRLFEIDTLNGNVIGNSYHYKTTKIKLVREISRDEIITYFNNHVSAKNKMIKKLNQDNADTNIYEKYCTEEFVPYKIDYSRIFVSKIHFTV